MTPARLLRHWSLCAPLAVLALCTPRAAEAQLVSPGKLAAAHADLEGLRQCTGCHELLKSGIANEKCLECHTALRLRITREEGFHAAVGERNCATCHKDHFGRDFDLLGLDTTAFDHSRTGFQLAGAHARTSCRECHRPEWIQAADVRAEKEQRGLLNRTYLGLPTICSACHEQDNRHGAELRARPCEDCHTATSWDDVDEFDHGATRYRLTGAHRDVACADCHRPTTATTRSKGYDRYGGVRFDSCTACHRDVHKGVMGANCESCHATVAWRRINRNSFEDRFQHDRTDFALNGAHAEVDCDDCHRRRQRYADGVRLVFPRSNDGAAYPRPLAADCLSCHLDYHDAAFTTVPGGGVCSNCHSETAWLPTSYDIARHSEDTGFPLTGGHIATPCLSCHDNPDLGQQRPQFRFDRAECDACHRRDDPHAGQFPQVACSDCHETDAFTIRSFDHSLTDYPLDGAHRSVPCAGCHPTAEDTGGTEYRVYKPLGTQCRDCHGGGS